MQRYLLLRFGQSIIALVGVTMLVFFLTRLSGNVLDLMLPIEATPEDFLRVEKAWGLDKPIVAQYGIYMWNVLHGDWGQSWKWGAGALEIVLEKFPATAQLAAFTLLISTTLGLSIGMLVAVKKDTPFDWGGKINVHGMEVGDADLVHADMHGAVVVPVEDAAAVVEEAKKIMARERIVIDASQRPDFNMEKLRAAWKGQTEIH